MGSVPHMGQVLGHYRLLERLGEGGMGVVWRAEDTRLQREVALKFLLADAARDSTRRKRFEQEARAAAVLSIPALLLFTNWRELTIGFSSSLSMYQARHCVTPSSRAAFRRRSYWVSLPISQTLWPRHMLRGWCIGISSQKT